MADYNAQQNQIINGATGEVRSDGGNQLGSEEKLQRITKLGLIMESRATPNNGSKPDVNLLAHEAAIAAGMKARVEQTYPGDPLQIRKTTPGGVSFIDNGDLAQTETQGNTTQRDRAAENSAKRPYSLT